MAACATVQSSRAFSAHFDTLAYLISFHPLPNELLSQIFIKIYKKISGLFFDRCLIFKVRF